MSRLDPTFLGKPLSLCPLTLIMFLREEPIYSPLPYAPAHRFQSVDGISFPPLHSLIIRLRGWYVSFSQRSRGFHDNTLSYLFVYPFLPPTTPPYHALSEYHFCPGYHIQSPIATVFSVESHTSFPCDPPGGYVCVTTMDTVLCGLIQLPRGATESHCYSIVVT